jgi:hypothetical protein
MVFAKFALGISATFIIHVSVGTAFSTFAEKVMSSE